MDMWFFAGFKVFWAIAVIFITILQVLDSDICFCAIIVCVDGICGLYTNSDLHNFNFSFGTDYLSHKQ